MKLRETLKLKTIINGLKKVSSIRPKIPHSSLLKFTVITIILLIALGVRLLPTRWGFYLSEFDPYYQYRQTKYIVENGYLAWFDWHDYMSWYPWGNDISYTSFPGLPMTGATLYFILNALGIQLVQQPSLDPLLSDPVYNMCVIFPVVMGTFTVLVMYFLGKELGGESVGIFAALFLALDSSYIGRTSLGWYDDETVGIFGILLFIILFMRSIQTNRSLKAGLFYGVAAGLTLGYLTVSWGAMRYPIAMIALFVFVLLVMGRYSPRLLLSYGIVFGLALSIGSNVPRLGRGFLFEMTILPVYGVFLLLCAAEINRRVETKRRKLIYTSIFVALLLAVFIFLEWKGLIKPLEFKYISVLNPMQRVYSPLTESVAEHRPSSWGTFYYNFQMGIFFVPLGIFFATMMGTNLSIFMIIYGLTSIYFASSMIRLNILMSPALCLLWALALTRLLKPFILFLRETPQVSGRKMRLRLTLGKEVVGGLLIVLFVLFALTYVIGTDFVAGPNAQGPRVFIQADAPVTIAADSTPLKPSSTARNWLDALTWMRENLPPSPNKPGEPGTVVASWWDYGYWITTIANRTTLADNGTWNWTQIRQIARMFMSPEDEAVEILKKHNVTHVVVFTIVHSSGYDGTRVAWGEVGKFKWMIRIANLNESYFGQDVSSSWSGVMEWQWSPEGKNTTLYKMLTYGKYMTLSPLGINLIDGMGQYIDPVFPDHFELVYPIYGKNPINPINGAYYALVLVFEVKY